MGIFYLISHITEIASRQPIPYPVECARPVFAHPRDFFINVLVSNATGPWVSTMLTIKSQYFCHDDVIQWKYFLRYWPFVRGIHWSLVDSPHKGQWRGALKFSLINHWAKNRDVDDLRHHRNANFPDESLRNSQCIYAVLSAVLQLNKQRWMVQSVPKPIMRYYRHTKTIYSISQQTLTKCICWIPPYQTMKMNAVETM